MSIETGGNNSQETPRPELQQAAELAKICDGIVYDAFLAEKMRTDDSAVFDTAIFGKGIVSGSSEVADITTGPSGKHLTVERRRFILEEDVSKERTAYVVRGYELPKDQDRSFEGSFGVIIFMGMGGGQVEDVKSVFYEIEKDGTSKFRYADELIGDTLEVLQEVY